MAVFDKSLLGDTVDASIGARIERLSLQSARFVVDPFAIVTSASVAAFAHWPAVADEASIPEFPWPSPR